MVCCLMEKTNERARKKDYFLNNEGGRCLKIKRALCSRRGCESLSLGPVSSSGPRLNVGYKRCGSAFFGVTEQSGIADADMNPLIAVSNHIFSNQKIPPSKSKKERKKKSVRACERTRISGLEISCSLVSATSEQKRFFFMLSVRSSRYFFF